MLGQALLLGAAELVGHGWVQGTAAVDVDGTPVEPWDDTAVAWSLLGALVASLERRTRPGEALAVSELAAACVALVDHIDEDLLDAWNDAPGRVQADVLTVLRAAIGDVVADGCSWN